MILLISGWKGSGKDTVAKYVLEKYGIKTLSFASYLKDKVSSDYDVPRHFFDDRDLKESPLFQYPVESRDKTSGGIHSLFEGEYRTTGGKRFHTPRTLAILEGSLKRSVNPNYWAEAVLKKIDTKEGASIPDWRFVNEYDAAISSGKGRVVTLRVNRFSGTESNDASERDLDNFNFDYVIENKGSMEDLYRRVDSIMADIERTIDSRNNPTLWS